MVFEMDAVDAAQIPPSGPSLRVLTEDSSQLLFLSGICWLLEVAASPKAASHIQSSIRAQLVWPLHPATLIHLKVLFWRLLLVRFLHSNLRGIFLENLGPRQHGTI